MIQLEVNGTLFENFTEIKAKRSMRTACGQFSIAASTKTQAFSDFPIKRGNQCKIIVDGNTWLTGYIDRISPSYTSESLDVVMSGRDITSDIIDSKILPSISVNGPISLLNLIKTALSQTGISNSVINNVSGLESFNEKEIIAPDIGTDLYDFLEEYCRKRGVLLLTDNDGNLTITRSTTELSGIKLQNKVGEQNNIVSASAVFDDSGRFNRYLVLSQINMSTLSYDGEDISNTTGRSGEALDDAIRSSRVKCIIAENPSSIPECEERAIWEANVSRSRSIQYSCSVDGHSYDGEAFDYNKLVLIDDDYAGVSAKMLIEEVELISSDQGNTANLNFVTPDAYQLQATAPSKQKNTNNIGLIWNDDNFQ